jgi:hypothetical protein
MPIEYAYGVPAAVARRHDALFWAVASAFLIVTALAAPLQLASPDGRHATDERDTRATPPTVKGWTRAMAAPLIGMRPS